MSDPQPPLTPRPSAMPVASRPRPRYFLGTFWAVVALICLIAGFSGLWWAVLLAIAAGAYSVYLYRGGKYGFWFW